MRVKRDETCEKRPLQWVWLNSGPRKGNELRNTAYPRPLFALDPRFISLPCPKHLQRLCARQLKLSASTRSAAKRRSRACFSVDTGMGRN